MSLQDVQVLIDTFDALEKQTNTTLAIRKKIRFIADGPNVVQLLPLVPFIRDSIESENFFPILDALNTIQPDAPLQYVQGQITVSGFYGPLRDKSTFAVYLTQDVPQIKPGWRVTGLLGLSGTFQVKEYFANVYSDVIISPGVTFPYVSYVTVLTDRPQAIAPSSLLQITFIPSDTTITTANVSVSNTFSLYDPRVFDASQIKGVDVPLRELGSNVSTNEGSNDLREFGDRGAGTGGLIALAARGPQDSYIFSTDCKFIPEIRQHTHFAQYHRVTPLLGTQFIGRTVDCEIRPREFGDVLTNIYLALTLPPIMNASWTNPIGRAIFEKVEFLIEDQVIEKITDDWYIIADQLFLDADEKLAMQKSTNGGYPEGNDVPGTQPLDLMIPLDFFFTRRHSHGTHKRQRIEVPGLPLCAMTLQRVIVRFTFRPQTWFTNYTTPIEFINPRVITEEILLSPEERLYYQRVPFELVVNNVTNEARKDFVDGKPVFNFTANYPVIMMSWFIRNADYEKVTDSTYFGSRYAYGYTAQNFIDGIPLTFFDGSTTRYIDPLQSCEIYINGRNIMEQFATGTYFRFKQPMEHGLSVPSKNIYMYSFGLTPKEFNQGGYLDFTAVNSETSKMKILYLPQYAPDIAAGYKISLYYYGYKVLQFKGGYATLKN